MPSLDLSIYKMGGNSGQYGPMLTGLPQPELGGFRAKLAKEAKAVT